MMHVSGKWLMRWAGKFVLGFGWCGGVWAGQGSCTWEEVTPLLKEQPGLLRFLERTLEISSAGMAFRFGPEAPLLDGRRTGPYRFEAVSRGESPERLEVVVETIPEYFDAGGAPIPKPPFLEAAAVRERFASVRIEPPGGEEGPAAPPSAPDSLAARTAWVQARCNEMNLADSRLDVLTFPGGGGVSGRITYHLDPAAGTVRMIVADAATEGGAAVSESYSLHEGELIFAFRRVTRAGGAVAETRHYFQDGEIYRTTRKQPGPGATAAEEDGAAPPGEALRVFAKVSRLALAADAAEAAAVYAADPDLVPETPR